MKNKIEKIKNVIPWVRQNDVAVLGGLTLLSMAGLTRAVYKKGYTNGVKTVRENLKRV